MGPHGEVMTTFGTDTKIFLNREMMDHFGTSGAFSPEAFGHFPPIFSRKFESRLFEDGHE